MLRRTPLKAKTPLRTKTPLRAKSLLRSVSPKKNASAETTDKPVKRKRRTEPNYVKDMDAVFQYWVRLRDSMPGGFCKCISCSKIVPFDKIQAGHFMSRKHMSVRWSPMNCNGECSGCNMDTSGNHLFGYEENLIKKIGANNVKWLKAESKQSRKWSDFEIKMLIKHYSQDILQLSSKKGIPISQLVQRIIKKYQKMHL